MKFVDGTYAQYNIAFAILLVWVFALAPGVANACSLNAPKDHSTSIKESAATTLQASAELLAPLAAAAHYKDADSTRESCLKVCGDSTAQPAQGAFERQPGDPTTLINVGHDPVARISTCRLGAWSIR